MIIPTTIERARELRKNMTDAERLLWSRLRRKQIHGIRFRRQHPVGPFIADFACTEARLVIEVDGGQHMALQYQDEARTVRLEEMGYRVLRFWNHQVLTEIDAVVHLIATTTLEQMRGQDPLPSPPPKGEGARREPERD